MTPKNSARVSKSGQRAVLVTGVASGIGLEIATHLLTKGFLVFGSLRSRDAGKVLRQRLGEKFRPLLFDVRDHQAIQRAGAAVRAELGDRRLSAAVNNAGLALFGPLQHLEDQDFREILEVNVVGVRNVVNAFLPTMGVYSDGLEANRRSPPTGKIINISSLSGILNTPMNGAYCISKHALESLGEVYRRELFQYGIDVVSIRPGPIRSKIWEKNLGAAERFRCTNYSTMAQRVERMMLRAQRDALPAAIVSKLVLDIIENRKRRPYYVVDRHKWRALLLARVLPSRWVDHLIWRRLGRRSKPRSVVR